MLTSYRSAAGAALTLSMVMLSSLVGGLPAQAASGEILGAGASTAIPGHYIVVLNDSPEKTAKGSAGDTMTSSAKALSDEYRGKLNAVYQRSLSGFAVEMDEAQARRLAADPRVAYVEQDQVIRIADTQENPPSPGLDRIDQRTVTLDTTYSFDLNLATTVTAYVVDTGIRITHNDFGGRASYGWDFVDGDAVADDCNGHGTHMAGVIGGTLHGVAKTARLKAVRAFNCAGTSTETSLQSAIEWITVNAVKPAVANLSLAFDCADGAGNPAACPVDTGKAIKTAMTNSIASGIPYVLAAGNQNIDACGNPFAQVVTAIVAGGSNTGDSKLNISNFGSCVDIWAPGQNITSDYFISDSATATGDGSSAAAAHVSGAVALMLARPGFATKTPAQLTTQLLAEATTGALNGMGAGSPDKLLYTSPPPVANGSPVALAHSADGRLTLFGVNNSGTLFVRSQTAPNATTWTPWTASVDPNWYSVCADNDNASRMKLIGLRRNYEPWHRTQAVVNANSWSVWQRFDGLLNTCATATESGRLYVFGTNAQGQLWNRSEVQPATGVFTSWIVMPGVPALRSVAAERNGMGAIQLFGLGRGGEIWHCWTISANCLPTGWTQMDGQARSIAVARNAASALSLYAVNAQGQLFRRDAVPLVNNSWLNWEQMDVPASVGFLRSVAADANADGRIELVVVNLAGQVWRRTQTLPGSTAYDAWVQLDGLLRP